MKKNISLLIVLACYLTAPAQRYRDIFPQVISAGEEKATELLNNFLINNLDHPNTNLRLGLLYGRQYRQVNPLREYEKAIALAEQARSRLIKATLLVTPKEFNKNREYYTGLIKEGEIPAYQELRDYMALEQQTAERFLERLPPIYREFTRSVESYDRAVKAFAAIVGRYRSLKELYLLYDDSLEQVMQRLGQDYDSARIYFDHYLELRKGFSLNAPAQRYRERPVRVYRLDGLVTQVNFLQPDITLWQYRAWADSVRQVVNTDIAALRQDLEATYTRLKAAAERAARATDPQEVVPVQADKRLMFNLMRFDYNTPLVPVLAYLAFSQHLSREKLRATYFDTARIALIRKLAYYNDMLYAARQADSLISEFDKRYDAGRLERHRGFVSTHFGRPEDLRQWMLAERIRNRQLFKAQAGRIRQGIAAMPAPGFAGREVRYRRLQIPLYPVTDSLSAPEPGRVLTRQVLVAADDHVYVAGITRAAGRTGQQQVVLLRLTPDLRPQWLQVIDLPIDSAGVDAHQALGPMQLTAGGVALLVHSVAFDSSRTINTLLQYQAGGQLKTAVRLPEPGFPQQLAYDENRNLFVVALQEDATAQLTVAGLNGLGHRVWSYNTPLHGNLLALITTYDGIVLAGNSYEDTGAGPFAFLLKLDYEGRLRQSAYLVAAEPYAIDRVFKVADNHISLLAGADGHIIVNSRLEVIYSSVNLR